MFPFNLSGPEFLLFYLILSIVVIGAMIYLQRRSESGRAPRADLSDPYLIAFLRIKRD